MAQENISRSVFVKDSFIGGNVSNRADDIRPPTSDQELRAAFNDLAKALIDSGQYDRATEIMQLIAGNRYRSAASAKPVLERIKDNAPLDVISKVSSIVGVIYSILGST